jgi:hypothetical protein
MHALVLARNGAQQFCGGTGNPAPNDARQLVVAATETLCLTVGYFRGGRAVTAHEKQGCFPNLALIGHHRRGHHTHKGLAQARSSLGTRHGSGRECQDIAGPVNI